MSSSAAYVSRWSTTSSRDGKTAVPGRHLPPGSVEYQRGEFSRSLS